MSALSRPPHHPHAGRIPLTVIGGFLGAGKTTLLNRMLARGDGRRLAVLVNDFGAVNIDSALVASSDADAISLSNGCVCCQIGGDLTDALIRVITRVPRPDAIVIEASGVSDPWRIAQVGLSDPALTLDGVVVLLDAAAVREQTADPLLSDTVLRQLHAADLLVLNHCDRIDGDALAMLREWLDRELPHTPRHETLWAEVPAALLGAPAADGPTRSMRCVAGCTAHDHHYHETHATPDHGNLFDTCAITTEAVYSADALRALLHAMPQGVMRLKGVVRTDRHGWAVLQFAGRHGSLRAWPSDTPAPDAATQAAIVAIGLRGRLPEAALKLALENARMISRHDAAPAKAAA